MPVIAVIGPSACGKSSVVRELHRRDLVRVYPTWTTRPRRPEEEPGVCVEHRFVTDDVFDELCANDFFVATVTPFGLRWRYGLPRLPALSNDRVDLVMLRAPVVEMVRRRLELSLVIQIDDDPERI